MPSKRHMAVLTSGGLDSAVLVALAAQTHRRVVPIYVSQGLRWERVELYWLKRFLRALANPCIARPVILKLPMADVYRGHWSVGGNAVPGKKSPDEAVYLPGRNPVLLLKAAIYCALNHISDISIGVLDHNPFPDASSTFFRQYAAALSRALSWRLSIRAPFRRLSKVEVLKKGKSLPLHLSFSCIAPRDKRHCGQCNKCAERKRAFRQAGVLDRTLYAGA